MECKVSITLGDNTTTTMVNMSTEELLFTRLIQGRAYSLKAESHEYLAEALQRVETMTTMPNDDFAMYSEIQKEARGES